MLRDVPGQQFVDSVGLVIRNVREHEFQVGAWIDVIQFARADQAIHGGSSLTTAVGAREHKVAPAMHIFALSALCLAVNYAQSIFGDGSDASRRADERRFTVRRTAHNYKDSRNRSRSSGGR